MNNKKLFWIILFIILFGILINIGLNLNHKYNTFKEHKDYFDLPIEQRNIESWMTLRMIKKEFGLKIDKELNLNKNFLDDRKTLKDFCDDRNLNLNQTILILEKSKIGKQLEEQDRNSKYKK